MKIGIISDTHDRLESLEKAVRILREEKVECIIHCGDWVSPFTLEFFDSVTKDSPLPVYSVFGNNEGDIGRIFERNAKLRNPITFSSKATLTFEKEGRSVVVYHGQDKNLLQGLIQSQQYDAVFTGHTHAVRNEVIGKTLVFNPGSTSFASESRIVDQASVGVYDTETNTARIIVFDKNDL